jgi:hypothetical protein
VGQRESEWLGIMINNNFLFALREKKTTIFLHIYNGTIY